MNWLEVVAVAGSVVVTLVGCGALGVRFVWRKTDKVRDELGQEIAVVRKESREAHEKIGEKIVKVQDDLKTEIGAVRDRLSGEIGQLNREIGRVGGNLEGVERELTNLQEDFRAHGFGRQAT